MRAQEALREDQGKEAVWQKGHMEANSHQVNLPPKPHPEKQSWPGQGGTGSLEKPLFPPEAQPAALR